MDYKNLIENNLQELANLVVILTTGKRDIESKLVALKKMLDEFETIKGDSSLFVAENFSKSNNPLLTEARIFAHTAFSKAKDSAFIRKYITEDKKLNFQYNETELVKSILEPLGSRDTEYNMPLANLVRLRIGVYGDGVLKKQRDSVAKLLKAEIRDKTISIYDSLLELTSKIEFIEKFASKFVSTHCFTGKIIENGRYVAQEKEWREYSGEGPSREYDPDWYGTDRKIIF